MIEQMVERKIGDHVYQWPVSYERVFLQRDIEEIDKDLAECRYIRDRANVHNWPEVVETLNKIIAHLKGKRYKKRKELSVLPATDEGA